MMLDCRYTLATTDVLAELALLNLTMLLQRCTVKYIPPMLHHCQLSTGMK